MVIEWHSTVCSRVRDGMFGTLIVQLPSSYTGGDCTVEFQGKCSSII